MSAFVFRRETEGRSFAVVVSYFGTSLRSARSGGGFQKDPQQPQALATGIFDLRGSLKAVSGSITVWIFIHEMEFADIHS